MGLSHIVSDLTPLEVIPYIQLTNLSESKHGSDAFITDAIVKDMIMNTFVTLH